MSDSCAYVCAQASAWRGKVAFSATFMKCCKLRRNPREDRSLKGLGICTFPGSKHSCFQVSGRDRQILGPSGEVPWQPHISFSSEIQPSTGKVFTVSGEEKPAKMRTPVSKAAEMRLCSCVHLPETVGEWTEGK